MTIINSTAVSATFTAPTYNGNSPINSYALIANGAIVGTNTGSPIVGTGLTSTNLVFSVAAVNDVGLGKTSDVVYATPSNYPINLTAPTISGTPYVGNILSVSNNGTWTHTISSYSYQWQRAGANIASATSSSYTLVSDDIGNVIRCAVIANSSTTSLSNTGFSSNSSSVAAVGQQAYTTAGTYSWVAPAGVTSVSVVCVGGGGGGHWYAGGKSYGGAGGGLGYKNNITVTPGSSYTVVVGAGGSRSTPVTGGAPGTTSNTATSGGNSYFISTATVMGTGGSRGVYDSTGVYVATGGTYVGDGGGNGGIGGKFSSTQAGSGGGAAGYSGNGGDGVGPTEGTFAGNSGSGGGGGSGSKPSSQSSAGGGGGGVGLLGQGSNGAGGASGSATTIGLAGNGGSGGNSGSASASSPFTAGGGYGGGGGGDHTGGQTGRHGDGGVGAVRIMWGGGRSYPSNAGSL